MAVAWRFSIGRLMLVVPFVAVDLAITQPLYFAEGAVDWFGVAVTTLPTINVLVLALPKLRRGSPSRAFWGGFEVVGWIGVFTLAFLVAKHWDLAVLPLTLIDRQVAALDDPARILIAIPLYATSLLTPAWLGGLLAARCRPLIVRR